MNIFSFAYPVIHLPQGDAVIAPECMGYRSMIAITILAFVYGLYLRLPPKKVLKLVGVALPIAILFNTIRILVCIAVGYYYYEFAFGGLHDIFGYVTFLAATLIVAKVGETWKPPQVVATDGETTQEEKK